MLGDIAGGMVQPWILASDWNAILSEDEYEGPRRQVNHSCLRFQDFLFDYALADMGFIGPKFTWQRGITLERLDRALCNLKWSERFPNARVRHLHRLKSDHRPLLIEFTGTTVNTNLSSFDFLKDG